MDSFNKTVSQLGNGLYRSIDTLARAMYMSNQTTQKQNVNLPNNLPNVHPILPQNISQGVYFSRADSYASYAEWLNDSQGQENWIIQKCWIIIKTIFCCYINTHVDKFE